MADITIPPVALEAAKSAYTAAIYRGNGTAREYHEAMRAACIAMLQNWPGMVHQPGAMVTKTWRDPGKIILPLPQEKQNG